MSLLDLFRPKQQKDILDLYPELEERVPIFRVNSDQEIASPFNSSFSQAATSYTNYMWLQRAINIIANNLAPLPILVARGSGNDFEYLPNHMVQTLLENPNPEMGSAELSRQWVVDMLLGGEVGFEAVWNGRHNAILELWPRQADILTVRADSVRYRRVAAYVIDDGAGGPYALLPDEFVHFKFYNPLQPFRGLTPVQAIKLSIVIDQLAQSWSRLFFKNQARPDFAIVAPEGITKTEKEEILKQLEENHSGISGVHKPIILEDGVTDIKTFSFAPKDTEWLNQREFSRDEVAAIVGVPDELMGFGKNTYENFDAADRILWTLSIMPLAGLRDSTLTRYCRKVGLLKENESLKTDTRSVPQLQEDKTGKITNAHTLFTMGVPVNVASEYLSMGLPSVVGGDIGYLPMGLAPLGEDGPIKPEPAPIPAPLVDVKPEEEPVDEEEPEGDEEEPEGDDTELAPEEEPTKALCKSYREYGSDAHVVLWKKLQSRLDQPVSALQRLVKREIQRQQNEVGQKLRAGKTYGRGLYKDDDQVPPPDELFDLESEIRKFIAAFESQIRESVEAVGNDELSGLGVNGVFDIDRPEVRAALRSLLEAIARKTNETTWNELVELFREAELAGEGIPAIQERLSGYFGDRKSDYQTERIARTTMVGASNSGTKEAWRQSNVVRGKGWVSALIPDRTRDAHAEAHGQEVGLDEMFTVDGESLDYPGDPSGDAGNIINCLCGMTAVIEE